MAPTIMAEQLADPECAALPLDVTDPMASHILAIPQCSDAEIRDRNQNGREENQGKHLVGRR
jgi:hypothetical protein